MDTGCGTDRVRRVDIESLKDGGPVKPEAEVGSLVADREDHCAGKGIMLAPIIVICCLASCCKMVYGKGRQIDQQRLLRRGIWDM